MSNNLGVCVAHELVPRGDQIALQLDPILDDPVVHHHHIAFGIGVRMGVDRGRCPVSRPTCMTDTRDRLWQVFLCDQPFEIGDPPCRLRDTQGAPMIEGNTGRVITPILEVSQTWNQYIQDGLGADISNYSAHVRSVPFRDAGRSRATRAGR